MVFCNLLAFLRDLFIMNFDVVGDPEKVGDEMETSTLNQEKSAIVTNIYNLGYRINHKVTVKGNVEDVFIIWKRTQVGWKKSPSWESSLLGLR